MNSINEKEYLEFEKQQIELAKQQAENELQNEKERQAKKTIAEKKKEK